MPVASSTVVQLSIAELVAILVFVLGVLYALARMIVSQMKTSMDSRFASLEQTTNALDATNKKLEQEVEQFNRLLPLEYVRREDWIRFSASIDAKLDRLAEMLMKRRE
jgi:hypothetical protein